ncbi:putative methyltransferase [Helianthus annuus]|nr:putative methyltransferase [Helianthus annuus]
MSRRMFLRSIYRLQNLSRSSSNINPKHAVFAAFQPLLHNRPYANTPQPAASASSVNQTELAKFAAIADSWWDVEGPFKPLHIMNPTRLAFLRSTLCRHFGKDPFSAKPFEGLKFVDVGCGGGILSEPLARMGASVTGIDAEEKNIKIARLHAV